MAIKTRTAAVCLRLPTGPADADPGDASAGAPAPGPPARAADKVSRFP